LRQRRANETSAAACGKVNTTLLLKKTTQVEWEFKFELTNQNGHGRFLNIFATKKGSR